MRKVALSNVDRCDLAIACGVAVLGLLALAMPDWLSLIMPPCLISLASGEPCWGCGITHAIVALLHGDFSLAWHYNARVFMLAPLLVWAYLRLLTRIALACLQGGRKPKTGADSGRLTATLQ
jgi:hypothetical protein